MTQNLAALFERSAAQRPGMAAVHALRQDGEVRETLAGIQRTARSWAKGLMALGVHKGATVAIVAETRVEWLIADIAIAMAGAVSVPVDPVVPRQDAAAMLADCAAEVVFVAGPFEVERCLASKREPGVVVRRLLVFERETRRDRADRAGRRRLSLAELVAHDDPMVVAVDDLATMGKAITDAALDGRTASTLATDLATLVYTAGTTGAPKGVELTHGALVHQVGALARALAVQPTDRVLLGLPLAFAFARIVAWVGLSQGIELLLPSRGLFGVEDLRRLQPTIVPAVPRQLEVLATQLKLGVHGHGRLRRRVVEWAVSVGVESSQLRHQGGHPTGLLGLRDQAATQLVLRQFPTLLGGRVRALISGGAPLPQELAEWYHAVGLELLEGYGLTECSACATLNRPQQAKLGTVGKALDGVELRIDDDGEILVRGPNVMRGYHNKPEASASVLDAEGWLHTGDIGELSADGHLRVTDRKKDVIFTGAGKAIAPGTIEAHLESSGAIATALVYGEGRPWLSALVVLDEGVLKRTCAEKDLPFTTYGEASQHPAIYRMIERVIEEKNRSLAGYETIKKFAILDRQLSIEDGDLTPTLKLRRSVVCRKYIKLLESFYEDGF